MEEATVVEWLIAPGDIVTVGQPIVEIETDKTTLEMESTESGKVAALMAQAGDVVSVGRPLCELVDDSHVSDTDVDQQGSTTVTSVQHEATHKHSAHDEVSVKEIPDRIGTRSGVKASPAAKRIAREYGVDLSTVSGSGPEGRIIQADIEDYLKSETKGDSSETELSKVYIAARQAVAKQVMYSQSTIPAFSSEIWINLEHLRSHQEQREQDDVQLVLTDYFLWALGLVSEKVPDFKRVWNDENNEPIFLNDKPTIGLAVATEHSIVVPAVSWNVGSTLEEISESRKKAVSLAKSGKSGSSLYKKFAIILSSLSFSNIERFNAIILPGSSSAVAVGGELLRPSAGESGVQIQRGCYITVSVDHRVIDGIVAAEMLSELKTALETQAWL